MSAMRNEAEILHREQMAARKRDLYQNDPNESPRKRAASKEYYKKHSSEKKAAAKRLYHESPEKKKESMAAYNEKHKEDINGAMHEKHLQSQDWTWTEFECHDCKKYFMTQKSLNVHMKHDHADNQQPWTCQICDKDIGYKSSLDRHMKEVHGEEKYHCEKCPAAFTRHGELQKHIEEGWHYLTYQCKQCDKKLTFKTLRGLIEHTIVKQSEGEFTGSSGTKWKVYKSGILVTCKSQVESTQLKEGEEVLCMPRKDKVKAAKERIIKKEEIINEGLQLAMGNSDAPKVKLELIYKKHEDDGRRKCKWCWEHTPYCHEFCEYRKPNESWVLQKM